MDIEIVDFYRHKETYPGYLISGTMHIFLIDWKIDLRGMDTFVKYDTKQRKYLASVWLPHRKAYDPDLKKVVRYPTIEFLDQDLKKEIIKKAKYSFIGWLKENENEIFMKFYLSKQKQKKIEDYKKPRFPKPKLISQFNPEEHEMIKDKPNVFLPKKDIKKKKLNISN